MLADFTGILVILVIGIILVCGMLGVHLLLGPRREFAEKQEPFECGEKQIVSPRQRYAVKFYMVAILFVIFDVEAVFIFPWALSFVGIGPQAYWAMVTFIAILGLGLGYAWKKGALQWR